MKQRANNLLNPNLRIGFAGTPEFSASLLKNLMGAGVKICSVYTQPDRRSGRGKKIVSGPVKLVAEANSIPVFQPKSLRVDTALQEFLALKLDLFIVAAYGLILPPGVLSGPKYGCINVHASLLPRWRGAAPIQHSILNGDTSSGVTIMQMDAGLDTGAMLLKSEIPISKDETSLSLQDKMLASGSHAMLEVLSDISQYLQHAEPQDEKLATYASKINKSDALVNWEDSATLIDRKIRAYIGWPVAYTFLRELQVRIWQASVATFETKELPGTIIEANSNGILVATGQGCLNITKIQLPGAKPQAVKDLMHSKSHLFQNGSCFVCKQEQL